MKKFITLSKIERKNLIQKAAFDLGMRFDVVEKDIWVCYVLGKLFSLKELHGKLVFKGGTCLSKAYGLIERFSEDVDLTISKSCLNAEGTSNKPRKVESRLRHAAEDFVKDAIYELLKKVFAKDLESGSWSLNFSEEDQSTLLFQFPRAGSNVFPLTFPIEFNSDYDYIKPSIKLDLARLVRIGHLKKKQLSLMLKKFFQIFLMNRTLRFWMLKETFLRSC